MRLEKIIKISVFILFISLFGIKNYTSASSLDSDLGIDLYKNIDKGIYELESKSYFQEITDGGQISPGAKFNKIIGGNCIKDDITAESLDKIEKLDINGSNEECLKNIKDECKKDGKTSIGTYLNVCKKISDLNKQIKKSAEKKAENITKVSRIGLYSDGDLKNSPFDLMKDLENIDEIIFTTKSKYEGTEVPKGGKSPLSNFIKGLTPDGKSSFINPKKQTGVIQYDENGTGSTENKSYISLVGIPNLDESSYVCSKDNNLSGLSIDILSNSGVSVVSEYSYSKTTNSGSYFSDFLKKIGGAPYKKATDDGLWNCDGFFCITMDFKTYKHNVLGGSKNLSIEGYIAKSNNHIYKFTTTSMAQKKMSINNWEFSLKNLNLSSIFNMNLLIQEKPAPILNIDKKGTNEKKEADSPFNHKQLLFEFYKNSGLDYNQANSIENFKKVLAKQKGIIDSEGLSIKNPTYKAERYKEIIDDLEKNNKSIENLIDMKVKDEDLKTFYNSFTELKIFTKSFGSYVKSLNGVIGKMAAKPNG